MTDIREKVARAIEEKLYINPSDKFEEGSTSLLLADAALAACGHRHPSFAPSG